jgi:hypothetical protein
MSKDKALTSGFWRTQLTTFAVLFAGYASYTYNRKSGTIIMKILIRRYLMCVRFYLVSFALPNLMKNGLLDKSAAGIYCIYLARVINRYMLVC